MRKFLLLGILSFALTGIVQAGNNQNGNNQDGNSQGGTSLPEPSQIAGILVLLGGTTLILRGRRKK